MATTASGVTIPGSSPDTTAVTPLQDHFNNLGKSLNGHVVVSVADDAARVALLTSLAAEGYTASGTRPVYVYQQNTGRTLVCYDGTNWAYVAGPPQIVENSDDVVGSTISSASTTATLKSWTISLSHAGLAVVTLSQKFYTATSGTAGTGDLQVVWDGVPGTLRTWHTALGSHADQNSQAVGVWRKWLTPGSHTISVRTVWTGGGSVTFYGGDGWADLSVT